MFDCTYTRAAATKKGSTQSRQAITASELILSLNDLIHITMADSKVESVQTFGRKVCIYYIRHSMASFHLVGTLI